MVFFFEFVYIVDYIDGFPYIELSLHPWDEANIDGFLNIADVISTVTYSTLLWKEIWRVNLALERYKEHKNIESLV